MSTDIGVVKKAGGGGMRPTPDAGTATATAAPATGRGVGRAVAVAADPNVELKALKFAIGTIGGTGTCGKRRDGSGTQRTAGGLRDATKTECSESITAMLAI